MATRPPGPAARAAERPAARVAAVASVELAVLASDDPTLRGLWLTAPYLHDGSAPTLLDVLTTRNTAQRHGATAGLTAQQRADLVAYLLQIDDLEPAAQ